MQVLELGCGNSQLCEELYKDGVTEITCIDLSAVAVENMQKKLLSKGLTGMLIDILQNIHTSNLLVERFFCPSLLFMFQGNVSFRVLDNLKFL